LIKVLPDDSFVVDLFSAKAQIVLSHIKLSGKKTQVSLYYSCLPFPAVIITNLRSAFYNETEDKLELLNIE